MNLSGAEMRNDVEVATKEARAVFTEAMNVSAEEAILKVRDELDMHSRRDIEEAVRVTKEDGHRKRS